ncbi:MAG: hypothetical protein ACFFD4_06485 [Candidatus Odinarchaeota archaeon]
MKVLREAYNSRKQIRMIAFSLLLLVMISLSSLTAAEPVIPIRGAKSDSYSDMADQDDCLTESDIESLMGTNFMVNNLDDPDLVNPFADEDFLTQLASNNPDAYNEYVTGIEQLSNLDFNSMEAYQYFLNEWQPEETASSVDLDGLSNESLSYEDALKDLLFGNQWTQSFSKLASDAESDDSLTTYQTDKEFVSTRQTSSGNLDITEKTTITAGQQTIEKTIISDEMDIIDTTVIEGAPEITLEEPEFSGLDNVSIKVKQKGEQITEGTKIVEQIVKIGISYKLPKFDKRLKIEIKFWKTGVRFLAWAKFEAGFHFFFPVKLVIEYPLEVTEGEAYSFKATLIPLDLPSYDEFDLHFLFDVGAAVEAKLPKLRHWKIKWRWKTLYGGGVYYAFDRDATYQTPLSGRKAVIPTGVYFDILPYIPHPIARTLSKYSYVKLGLGNLVAVGQSVTGVLKVLAGNNVESRDVVWTNPAGELKNLIFKAPDASVPSLRLRVCKLVFHARDLYLQPMLYLGLKDLKVLGFRIKLSKIRFKIPLPKLHFGSFNLPSRYSYTTASITIDPAEVYGFDMKVEEITPVQGEGVLATIGSQDKLYRVTIDNTGGKQDTIKLEVSGLPPGYTATFDQQSNLYPLGDRQLVVNFIVSPPYPNPNEPNTTSFTVTATSMGKVQNGLPDPSISKSAPLVIPITAGYTLDFDTDVSGVIQVYPGDHVTLGLYVHNLGNQEDILSINATLYTDHVNRTFDPLNFVLGRYGTATMDNSSTYSFKFAADDIFPSPGVYKMEINASSLNVPLIRSHELFFNFTAAYGIKAEITPTEITVRANYECNFTLTVNNTGNTVDNFTLQKSGDDPIPNYLFIYPDEGVLDIEPNETREVTITLRISDPSSVPANLYRFRIKVESAGSGGAGVFAAVDVQVNLLEAEYVPPEIFYMESFLPLDPLVYPTTSSILGPSWMAYDETTGSLDVYVDGVYNATLSGSWTNGIPVQVPVTGSGYQLAPGLYNITVVFNDAGSNSAMDQKWILIIGYADTVDPLVTPLNGTLNLPLNFTADHVLVWNCTEEFPLNSTLTLYKDGTEIATDLTTEQEIIEPEPLTWQTKFILQPGMIAVEGSYNFTLEIGDMGGKIASANITVNMASADSTPPDIDVGPATEGNQSHGEIISITATDLFPDKYELWINSSLVVSGSWLSGVPITFNVDDLEELVVNEDDLVIGDNDFEIVLFDKAGNSHRHPWTYLLHDVDKPVFLLAPSDFTAYEHTQKTMEVPYWQVQDKNPGNYEIYLDGVLVEEGIWGKVNNSVEVPLINLSLGTYTFEGRFFDSSGNWISSSVQVTVTDGLEPYIWPISDIRFEPLYTADWFEFFISEAYPDSYELYRNGTLIDGKFLTNEFPVVFVSISDLETGNYSYTLKVFDQAGNVGEITVLVEVADHTPPAIKRPPDLMISEGSTGYTLFWDIREANPQNYSLYRNGELLIDSDPLTATNITTSLDGLAMGEHEYTLIVVDEFGLSHSCTCYVNVVDITAPALTHLSDVRFITGDANAKLTWTAQDLHPASYSIKLDGADKLQNTWSNGEIALSLVGWSAGSYEVEITVSDTSGNTAIDTVQVTIVDSEEKTAYTEPKSFKPSPGFTMLLALVAIAILMAGNKVKRTKKQ